MFSARARQKRSLLRVTACLILVLALTMGPAAVARWETRTEQQCSPTQVCQDIAKQVPDCRTETVCRPVPVTTQRCTNVPVCQMVTQYRQNCVPVRGSNVPRCSNVPYQQQVCTTRQNCVPVTTQQQQCTPQQKCTTKTVSTKQCRSEQKCTTVTRQVWVPDPAPAAGAGQKAVGAPPPAPAPPKVPSQRGNTPSPAHQQELARIKQQAEEIQAKLNAYQRQQQQQAPVAGAGQKAIATPSHPPSAQQINPQPAPAQAAAGQPAFKSLGRAAGSPPSAPAPTSPSPYSFVRKDNGNVEVFRDGQRISTGTAEYAAQAYGYKPQIPAGGPGQPSGNAPSPAFKPFGTASSAPSASPSSSGFVRIETTNGPAFFQKTPSGLAAVSDQSTLQKLRAGAIPSETQPSIAGGADRFSSMPAPGQLQASPAPTRALSLPDHVGVYSPAKSALGKAPDASADRQPTFGSLKPSGTPASHGTPSQAAAIGAAASNSGFGHVHAVGPRQFQMPEALTKSSATDMLNYALLSRRGYSDFARSAGSVFGYTPEKASWIDYLKTDKNLALYKTSGFDAKIYKKGNEIVISYGGTESLKDWKTNFQSKFWNPGDPVPAQYEAARRLAEEVKARHPGYKVTLTGHSLGGGMASYAGTYAGDSVVTFNAARNGLSVSGKNKNQTNVIVSKDAVGDPTAQGLIADIAGDGYLNGRNFIVKSNTPVIGEGTIWNRWYARPIVGHGIQGFTENLVPTHPMDGLIGHIYEVSRSK